MFGIIISGLSTFFATQRYLNLKQTQTIRHGNEKKGSKKKFLFGKSNYIFLLSPQ